MKPIFDANEYIRTRYMDPQLPFTRAYCQDGYSVSIQASSFHYCIPRTTSAPKYEAFELGFSSGPDPLIDGYSEENIWTPDAVYPYVPSDIVDELLAKHGGIVYWN